MARDHDQLQQSELPGNGTQLGILVGLEYLGTKVSLTVYATVTQLFRICNLNLRRDFQGQNIEL